MGRKEDTRGTAEVVNVLPRLERRTTRIGKSECGLSDEPQGRWAVQRTGTAALRNLMTGRVGIGNV